MLPAGIAADLPPPSDARRIAMRLAGAQTTARLLVGACSCDFFLARDPGHRREESELRRRHRLLGSDRRTIIGCLARHRAGLHPPRTLDEWQAALAAFVAEHARNARSALFYHEFADGELAGRGLEAGPVRVPLADVAGEPGHWLPEDRPVLVLRD
jgi:hypothetical protein